MRKNIPTLSRIARGVNPGLLVLGVVCIGLLAMTPAANAANLSGLTVMGVNPDGTTTELSDYRWLVEEDLFYHAEDHTVPDPNTLSVSFHRSYMPVVAKGCVNMPAAAACSDVPASPTFDTSSHYYVSVVPRNDPADGPGYSIGGAEYVPGSGATVYVNINPIPTAQISILLFEDNKPLNGAPDLPGETPGSADDQTDMKGFRIVLEDAGGRYGISAGVQSQDAFGNPLCTEYEFDDLNGNDQQDPGEPYFPDVDGLPTVKTLGSGCTSGSDGRVAIKHLAPGKYGIQAVPPVGHGWQQTSTIEGTKLIDAWVKGNEPNFFAEFGPPGFHVFIGFIRPDINNSALNGSETISGKVVNLHMSRPPDYAFYNGACFGHTTPWVALNSEGGLGPTVYAAPTDDNCNFSIPNVPRGAYTLTVFDENMDLIIASKGVIVDPNGAGGCSTLDESCDLGEVPVFQWFTRMENHVYFDSDGDGFPDDNEQAMLEQNVNLRWRDGTIYQAFPTDGDGVAPFDQVFPFFSWLVAEVDFGRFQATGVTVAVDDGGPIPAPPTSGPDYTAGGQAAPQSQVPGNTNTRTEKGPVLTQAFQGFIGQTSSVWWGKGHYPDGANGGISGMVFYAVTRAEDDPEYAAAEPWEPGIPGVTVNLYKADGTTLLATTETDSWDESLPTNCQDGSSDPFEFPADNPVDCYDGLRNFNQVRPGVFDGGYAFGPEFSCADDFEGTCPDWISIPDPINSADIGYLNPGYYVVEVIAPLGYEILKPEDKNVDFGDAYFPSPLLLPPPCVGADHTVPTYLTLFPDMEIVAPFAGTDVPLCDRKLVTMSQGANAAADFFLFTEVPIATHAFGFILDDTQNEFDPNSPQFGEKYAPPFLPVSIRDWTGREIGRTLSDQFGRYNFLAPSTITTNLPAPSGMSPNMLTTCMNDATLPDGSADPNHNPIYSQFCYTFQYMPGTTTYLDTPVVPVGAFAGAEQFPLDCEFPDGTPRIYSVSADNGVGGGPYLASAAGTITIDAVGDVAVANPNYCNPNPGLPDTCPTGADTNKLITRDYGFGETQGSVTIGDVPLNVTSWDADLIIATVPSGTVTGQLTVTRDKGTRDNGLSSINGVTFQIGVRTNATVRMVNPSNLQLDTPIQDAIEVANDNDLILVGCGPYNEMVVMWKPVQLQGWGECTTINAVKAPADKLEIWRGLVDGLVEGQDIDLLPGQEFGAGAPEPVTLFTEEGAGVLVLAKAKGKSSFGQNSNQGARIDGFTIKGADTGGGIVVNGFAEYLEISNNRIANNQGFFGGGIRVGHPELAHEQGNGLEYDDAENDYVKVRYNHITNNGGLGGAGAGISMCTGSDSYEVTRNYVCGNFSLGDGGGIGHVGLSKAKNNDPEPLIAYNMIIFNESFNQGLQKSGGGLYIGGAAPLPGEVLSPGAGNVQVIGNLIQGNSAAAGDGGGIRLERINGLEDVTKNNKVKDWFHVDLFNNIMVNNVTGLAGGGISMQDAVNVRIVNNTIANNDSLATAERAFALNSPNESTPQGGAGIVSRDTSSDLQNLNKNIGTYSDPTEFADNIVWHNRKFFFFVDVDAVATPGCTPSDPSCVATFGLCPDIDGVTGLDCGAADNPDLLSPTDPWYDDLAVIGTADNLECVPLASCILTGGTDPLFVAEYINGDKSTVLQPELTTGIQAPPAFDEGGNFIRPQYGPLTRYIDDATPNGDPGILFGDYHIQVESPAKNNAGSVDLTGTYPELVTDFDGEPRPEEGTRVDIGADEEQSQTAKTYASEQPQTRSGVTGRTGSRN